MLNMRDPKTKKIISTIIVVVLVLAMIVPMALSALMYFLHYSLEEENL